MLEPNPYSWFALYKRELERVMALPPEERPKPGKPSRLDEERRKALIADFERLRGEYERRAS